MRVLIATFAFVLAACGQTSAPAPEPAAESATEAQRSPFTGAYIAVSTTAMSITGDMEVSADVLSFARGFRIEGGPIESTLAGATDLSAGGGTINDGSGMQATDVELRRVETVRVAADARDPSLCGEARASYVILGREGDRVTLQVFSGAEAPGPNAHNTQLCGIFNYQR